MTSLYQKTILDHSRTPRHAGILDHPDQTLHGLNPLCGDEIWIYMRRTASGTLEATFESDGCSLCRASGSILLEIVNGEPPETLLRRIDAFCSRFAAGKDPEESEPHAVRSLYDLRAFPSRSRCVLLAWETLAEGLRGQAP